MPARRKAKATTNQDGSNVEESTEVSMDTAKITVRQNKGKETDEKESSPTDTTTESAQTGQSEPPAKKKKGKKGKEVVASEQSADAIKQDDKSAEEPSKKTEIGKQESKAVDELASSPKKGAKTQSNKSAANEEAAKKTTSKAQTNKKVNKAKKTNPAGEIGDRVLRSNSKIKNGYVMIFIIRC